MILIEMIFDGPTRGRFHFQIGARAKATSRASQDDDPNRVIAVYLGCCVEQFPQERVIHCVELLGTVERDDRNRLFPRNDHFSVIRHVD